MDSSVNTSVRAHIVLTPFYFSLSGGRGCWRAERRGAYLGWIR